MRTLVIAALVAFVGVFTATATATATARASLQAHAQTQTQVHIQAEADTFVLAGTSSALVLKPMATVKCETQEDLDFRGLAYRLYSPKAEILKGEQFEIVGSVQVDLLVCRKNSQGEIGWSHAETFTYSYPSTVDGQPVQVDVLLADVELMHVTRNSEYLNATEFYRAPKNAVKVDFKISLKKSDLSTEPIRTVFFLKTTKFYQINGGDYQNVGPVRWKNIQLWVYLQKTDEDTWGVDHLELR